MLDHGLTNDQIDQPLKHLSPVLQAFDQEELDLTWQVTKSATCSIILPLLTGMLGCELSTQGWGKFLLEILMTYTVIEARQYLENTFASASEGHPMRL